MSWKAFVADYLTFTRKERLALLFFFGALLALYFLSFLTAPAAPAAIKEDAVLSQLLDSATQLAQNQHNNEHESDVNQFRYEVSKNRAFTEGELFAFDPNTLPAAGWKKLGLPDRTVNTILNYRNKGGHFYKPNDLKKIWGLPAAFYERVAAYIQIAETKKEYASNADFFKTPYAKKERRMAVVDVNTADTAALIALPGIGAKLAQRIISFRDKLGGFYTTDQIGETYGLPDSTFQKLKPFLQVHGVLKKFNLNTASKEELRSHPYIKWNIANAIVEYRNQHGPFKKPDELKNIMLIDDAAYQKMAPYLSL